MSRPNPPQGFVHLILSNLQKQDPQFYLEIPISVVNDLCLHPGKYLLYLGWCVLGNVGILVDEIGNENILELHDKGSYWYTVPEAGDNPFVYAIDLEVIKQQSQVPSETTTMQENFYEKVLARDGCCVWTCMAGMAAHIIPHSRGDEWLQLIMANRPHTALESVGINDIQNGLVIDDTLHNHYFDPRQVVVLKTPNAFLETTDIPDRPQRELIQNVSYPDNCRYTLHWIVPPPGRVLHRYPNNTDAAFMSHTEPKPSDLLLHYNYGAAVVKHWGRNIRVITTRPNIPRPAIPVPAPMGPTKIKHDRTITINKRAAASSQGSGQNQFDEDDVMLFFWANSRVAQERRAQKTQERADSLEKWRADVLKSSLDV